MAKTFKLTGPGRAANAVTGTLLRWGLPMGQLTLLTVRGRKSGKEYSVPVYPIVKDGVYWLVSPYGEMSWARNLRAAGEARLTRRRQTRAVKAVEVGGTEAAPILKQYLDKVAIVRPFFDVTTKSSLQEFEQEAPRHPVFRVVE